jgi:hypothetical protein
MPFIASLGRRACNSCRKVTPKGGTVYQGDITGMVWCESCAETVGGKAGRVDGAVRSPQMAGIRDGLKALADKYQWTPPRSWNEGEHD